MTAIKNVLLVSNIVDTAPEKKNANARPRVTANVKIVPLANILNKQDSPP